MAFLRGIQSFFYVIITRHEVPRIRMQKSPDRCYSKQINTLISYWRYSEKEKENSPLGGKSVSQALGASLDWHYVSFEGHVT